MAKPKLRFPEFMDEWERKVITEIADTYIGLVTTMTAHYVDNGTPLIRNSDIKENKFVFKEPIYLDKEFADINSSRKHKLNDIITVHTGDIGTSALITEELVGSIGFATIVTRITETNIFPQYICWYYNTDIYKNYARNICTGDGRNNLNMRDFNVAKLSIPCLKEQQKIADFLSKVDKKIANQEAAISDYEEMKKGLMQKIFSQEVRFKADDGSEYPEWEEKKLLEIATIYDGTHQTPNYVEQGIPFVSVENIKNLYKTNKYITKEAFEKEFKIYPEKGDILMTRIGDIGTASLVSRNMKIAYYVSLALLKPQENILADYLVQYISNTSFQKELWKRTLHIAFPKKINKGEIGECKVKAPCLEEQQKIADCLSAMDRKIEAEKKILKDWKELKKALLQQMFI